MKRIGATRRDTIWTVITTGVGAVLQLIQLMIAARYLDSYAFGVLAIVNVAVWIVMAFQDMGLSSYCIHLGASTRQAYSTLFWISSALGVLGGFIIYVLAYPVSSFYRIPELQNLLPVVGVNFILVGVSSQYQAHYVRCFQAKKLAQFELIARLLGFLSVIGLLHLECGVESIILGLLVFSFVKMMFLIVFSDMSWRPLVAFQADLAIKSLKYGSYQAGSQVVNQIRTQADQLILGRALGPESLGVYSLAKELVTYPLRFAQPLFSRLVLPVLAGCQSNESALEVAFKKTLSKTAILSSLVYVGVVLFSASIVEIMYGDQFSSVAELIPLIVLFGVLRPLGLSIGMLAQATGRTSNEFRWNLIASLISLPMLFMAGLLWPEVEVFAISTSIIQVVLTFMSYSYFIKPMQPIGFFEYLRAWGGPSVFVAVVSVVCYFYPLPAINFSRYFYFN